MWYIPESACLSAGHTAGHDDPVPHPQHPAPGKTAGRLGGGEGGRGGGGSQVGHTAHGAGSAHTGLSPGPRGGGLCSHSALVTGQPVTPGTGINEMVCENFT